MPPRSQLSLDYDVCGTCNSPPISRRYASRITTRVQFVLLIIHHVLHGLIVRAFLFANRYGRGCREYAAASEPSVTLDRNILPGFRFPFKWECRVSNIRCQRLEKRRDTGLQLQLNRGGWLAEKKPSSVPLIYETPSPSYLFPIDAEHLLFCARAIWMAGINLSAFPVRLSLFYPTHRHALGETFSGNQSSLFGYFFTCEIPQIGRRGDRRLDDPRTALLMDAHSEYGRAQAKSIPAGTGIATPTPRIQALNKDLRAF